MSMLQIGILGVAGVLLGFAVQKVVNPNMASIISIVLGLFDLCHFAWEDQPDQRCVE